MTDEKCKATYCFLDIIFTCERKKGHKGKHTVYGTDNAKVTW